MAPCIAAASASSGGKPAVLVMSKALGPRGFDSAVQDYLGRYRPQQSFAVAVKWSTLKKLYRNTKWKRISHRSPAQFSQLLARKFWKRAGQIVVVNATSYADALLAAPLAAKKSIPLVLVDSTAPMQLDSLIKRLRIRSITTVGQVSIIASLPQTNLHGSAEVATAIGTVAYMAVTNPNDQHMTQYSKLSLLAPLIAAARGGSVFSLSTASETSPSTSTGSAFGTPGTSAVVAETHTAGTNTAPSSGAASETETAATGTVVTNGAATSSSPGTLQASTDVTTTPSTATGPGTAAGGTSTASTATGADTVSVGGAAGISTGAGTNAATGTVGSSTSATGTIGTAVDSATGVASTSTAATGTSTVVTGSAENVSADSSVAQIKMHINVVGVPKYLALVGGPDAIPFHVFHSGVGNWGTEKIHDAPYANIDNDPFLDVAVGRLVAKNLGSLSLLVSRIATYEHLFNGEWEMNSAIAGDLQQAMYVMSPAFTNVGFREERLANGNAPSLEKSAIVHNAHSWYTSLGGLFSSSSRTVLAPAVVTSSGCSTAGIDRSGPENSVALHLLHQGALAFMGAPHNAVTRQKFTHHAFWNALLRGETLGAAFTEAMNDWVVVVQEDHNGNPIHASQNVVLFGDPAFRMLIPQSSASPPARLEQNGNILQVHAPQQWTKNSETDKLSVEWKWNGNLNYYGAPGVVPLYYWAGKYDKSKPYYFARHRLTTSCTTAILEKVSDIEVPQGVGWTGSTHIDEHSDGSCTLLWRVRLLDFDVETGVITSRLNVESFRVIDELVPTEASTTSNV